MKYNRCLNRFLVAVFLICLVGCGKTNSFGVYSTMPGFIEFKDGFYKWSREQGCSDCHSNSIVPLFSSANVVNSYNYAKSKLDIYNPTDSPFINQAGNSHCGEDPCSNPANSSIVEDLIIAWANAEILGNTGGGPALPTYVTASLPIPANLPNMTSAPALLRFPLSQLSVPLPFLTNATLELEINLVNPTTYRLQYPKIAGNTSHTDVFGIHVYVGDAALPGVGTEDTTHGDPPWNSLNAVAKSNNLTIPPNGPIGGTNPPAGLRLSTTATQIQKGDTPEKITVGFELLAVSTYVPVTFATMQTVLTGAGCAGCHTNFPTQANQFTQYIAIGGGAPGYIRLIDPDGDPMLSPLYTALQGVSGSMPLNQPPISEANRLSIFNYIRGL